VQKTNFIHRFFFGIRRNWKRTPVWLLVPYGFVWAIVEPITYYSDSVKNLIEPYRLCILLTIIVLSVVYTLYKICEPLKIKFNIGKTGTSVEIVFGEIFSQDCHIAIPANEFFDTQIGGSKGQVGDIVAPYSLHGLFISKIYNSDTSRLDAEITTALTGVYPTQVARTVGKNQKYPIGTTAVLGNNSNKKFLFALSNTDVATNKASADVPTMWKALEGLWSAVRNHSNGLPVSIPLVGGGLSHVGLEPENLLRLIILSIIKSSEQSKITSEIRIVLHNSVFDKVALRKIKQEFI